MSLVCVPPPPNSTASGFYFQCQTAQCGKWYWISWTWLPITPMMGHKIKKDSAPIKAEVIKGPNFTNDEVLVLMARASRPCQTVTIASCNDKYLDNSQITSLNEVLWTFVGQPFIEYPSKRAFNIQGVTHPCDVQCYEKVYTRGVFAIFFFCFAWI